MRAVGIVTAAAVGAATAALVAIPAQAAVINPLAGAGGASVFVLGNATLANAEVEGSLVVGGNLALTKGGYPLRHTTGLTPTGYTLPVIDGHPARLVVGGRFLAGTTESNGQNDIASAGYVTASQKGWVKIGDTSNIQVTARSGNGLWISRLGSSSGDQPALFVPEEIGQTPVSLASVALANPFTTYFPEASSLVGYSQQIAALPTSATAVATTVEQNPAGYDAATVRISLTNGKTNLVDYTPAVASALAGKSIVFGTNGVVPSASTPLIFRIAATTGARYDLPTFAAANNTSSTQPNSVAPYVLWNISSTSGAAVTVTGKKVSGSVFAPSAALTLNVSSPIEGQIIAGSLIGLSGSGEFHHYGFGGLVALSVPSVSVGDKVWHDTNRNGVQDAGEPGIAGVTVTLTGPGGGSVTTTNGAAVGAATTSSSGVYSFADLPVLAAGQSYTVTVASSQSALAGFIPTITGQGQASTDSSTGSAASVTTLTTDKASDTTLDFGFVRPRVSVGDRVWLDSDKDGTQDAGEPGIAGVTVTIAGPSGGEVTSVTGAAVGAVTTDAAGSYTFTNLPVLAAGQHYTVSVDAAQAALAAYRPTTPGVGSAATDSSTGTAASATLTTDGASDLTLDFGFITPSVAVGDRVWLDTNRNGVQDSGESGISGVTVSITGPGGGAVVSTTGTTVAPTTTSATGTYGFSNLPALASGQHYTVTIDGSQPALAGYVPTVTGAGTTATDSSSGSAATVAALATDGAADLTLDFGFVPAAVSVGNRVWLDTDRDGVQDTGEPGIAGVRLTITGPSGAVTSVTGSPVAAVTTDADGAYLFSNLPVLGGGQSYTVHLAGSQTPLAGLVPTTPAVGSDRATDSSTGLAASGDLTVDGASDLTLDFGLVRERVAVGDRVWLDTDRDGLQDSGEPGVAGVQVTLTGPAGAVTSVTGAPVGAVTTDASGGYEFSNLPVLAAGQSYTVHLLGTQAALAGLEPTVAGAGSSRAADSSTATAASTDLTVDGAQDSTLDFGFVPARVAVGDMVWLDTDRDGIQDAGEPGIAGVTVAIVGPTGLPVTDVLGRTVAPVETDADGRYGFADLPVLAAGRHYTVNVDTTDPQLAGLVATVPGAGSDTAIDSATGSAASSDLTSDGATDTTLDFGFVRPQVSVGDTVWFDADADGINDAGEDGIAGVRLTITGPGGAAVTDVTGTAVGAATTDGSGRYRFSGLPVLPAGQGYTVHMDGSQSAIAALVPTVAEAGTDRAVDSSTGTATSGDLTVDGAADLTLDFGLRTPPAAARVSLGDLVWLDTDRDGVQDAGEQGIAGVELTITGPAGAVTDVDGLAVGATTTDAAGRYSFVNLPVLAAGQHYTVHLAGSQAVLSGYSATTAGAGADRAADSSAAAAASTGLAVDGASDPSLDFGFVRDQVSLGDLVWHDLDRDGVQDAGEQGISGVRLTVAGPGGAAVTDVFGAAVLPTTTDAAGRYTVTGLPSLPAGQHYSVTIDGTQPALAGLIPTVAGAGADRAVDSSSLTGASTDLTSDGAADPTIDFGFVAPRVFVGDVVWRDLDHDGRQDAGEPGIDGVVLTLTGPGGAAVTDVFGQPVGQVTTAHGGVYTFADLPALPAGQHYTVAIAAGSQPALVGLVPTLAHAAPAGADSSTGTAESGDLTADRESDVTLDFGFVTPAVSIGDLVWLDSNRDGVQQLGEPGIAGVTVTVTGPGGSAVTSTAGAAVAPVVTGSDGRYAFTDLPTLPAGQHYTVVVDSGQAALRGYSPTSDGIGPDRAADSSTGSATSGDLTSDGAADRTLDFGFVVASVSIGNRVWIDRDRDGLQDPGEPGIDGVTVQVSRSDERPARDLTGTVVGDVVTSGGGYYSFTSLPILPAGVVYRVQVDEDSAPLATLVPTLPGVGDDRATDSATTRQDAQPLLVDGASDLTLDFGYVLGDVTVGDLVWFDSDGDGIQDVGEPGIGGVKLTLTGPGGTTVISVRGALVGPTTTAADGSYAFTDLPVLAAGESYTVTVDPTQTALAGHVPTVAGSGGAYEDSSTGSATSQELTSPGWDDPWLDFGFVLAPSPAAVSLGDTVWLDDDRDGVQDAGERGIAKVTLTITGPGGAAALTATGATVPATTTDATGVYAFSDLAPLPAGQHYTVHVDPTQSALTGYLPTLTGAGTPATDSSDGSAESGDLVADGDADTSLDFGFVVPVVAPAVVSVGDTVWSDSDADGVQDAGEPGIAGVVVTLTGPSGAAVTDVDGAAVTSVTTDTSGRYTFTRLPVLAAGDHYTVAVAAVQPSLAGLTPTVTGRGTAATDSSTGSAVSGDLTADGASDLTLDFGFVTAVVPVPASVSVGDLVWDDLDRDGVQDAGEPGIDGVELTIVGPTGAPVQAVDGTAVAPVTTAGGGRYVFANLPVLAVGEAYTVRLADGQAALAGYVPTAAGIGDAATDSSTAQAVSGPLTVDRAADAGLDFGFVRAQVRLGNLVWLDADKDGVQDAGELGLPGVVLTITGPGGAAVRDVTGALVGQQVTAADGSYLFTGLPPLPAGQHYTVSVDNSQQALVGYVPTVVGAGDAATDSSDGSAVAADLVGDGAADLTMDFGFVTVTAPTPTPSPSASPSANPSGGPTPAPSASPTAPIGFVLADENAGKGAVSAATTPPPSKRGATLATTGADVMVSLAAAALLVTVGAVLWLLATRRRRQRAELAG